MASDDELFLYNTFEYKTPEDFIYFILFSSIQFLSILFFNLYIINKFLKKYYFIKKKTKNIVIFQVNNDTTNNLLFLLE